MYEDIAGGGWVRAPARVAYVAAHPRIPTPPRTPIYILAHINYPYPYPYIPCPWLSPIPFAYT